MPSTSTSTEQAGSVAAMANAAPGMHPELLMAACHGDYEKLADLFSREDEQVAVHRAAAVVVEIEHPTPSSSASPSSLLQGITPDGDSALHVVAASGDDGKYLESAKLIHGREHALLQSLNQGRSTPLHCAARAGNASMLSLLIDLAQGGDEIRVRTLLRMENRIGETALHEAIRVAHMPMVRLLMEADPCLARFPDDGGASPLFLAILLGHDSIALELHTRDNLLSYSGPGGQNALHVAVLHSKDMTKQLLRWNKELTKKQDIDGNTPLHFALSLNREPHSKVPQFAVSVGKETNMTPFLKVMTPQLDLTKELLEADTTSAFQPDKKGSFPVHVAASAGRLGDVKVLVTRCPGCAGLCDAKGRTFIHIAVTRKRHDIVAYACHTQLSNILNKQDNDGNTALHLAVDVGDWRTFASLFVKQQVDLNLPNNARQTPRELSVSMIPRGLYYVLNSRILIQQALICACASCGSHRRDENNKQHDSQLEQNHEDKESEKMSSSTEFLGIGLVLITTMAFGATFTMPGGYRADGDDHRGTATLAGTKLFHGFIMANALAMMTSSLAVISLVFSGTPTVDMNIRYVHYNMSRWLALSSAEALCTAFAIAIYMMITPIAVNTAVAVIAAIVAASVLYIPALVLPLYDYIRVVYMRLGVRPLLDSNILKILFLSYWPFIVIFVWQEYAWRHRPKI